MAEGVPLFQSEIVEKRLFLYFEVDPPSTTDFAPYLAGAVPRECEV